MAFRGDSTDTYTYASGSTGSTVDLGARNNYRYINASNVYNKGKSDGQTTHTQTYTFATNDTGGTKDLGVNHYYRYVNASNVYNKGKVDGSKWMKSATELYLAANGTGYLNLRLIDGITKIHYQTQFCNGPATVYYNNGLSVGFPHSPNNENIITLPANSVNIYINFPLYGGGYGVNFISFWVE